MKAKIFFFLRLIGFWYGFFVVSKIIFLLFNLQLSFKNLSDWPGVFYHGFKLDFSTIGYILVLPSFLLALSGLFKRNWPVTIITYFSYLLLFVFSFLIIADLAIYREWGFRLDATPLIYLNNIRDAFASTPLWQILLLLCIVSILTGLFIVIFNKTIKTENIITVKREWIVIPIFILITGSLIIPIRGGFGTAPINTGSVYFHQEPFMNHAALNLPWNVLYSVTKTKVMVNPYQFDPQKKSDDIISDYCQSGVTSEYLLNTEHPNIILIVLESFTSNVVGCLNEKVDATPYLDSCAKNGLLFKNFFASGVRSDKGLVAILSGYPAQPNTSIMIFPEKTQRLPGLPKTLSNHGYSSTFYYGGDINFASMKSYLINIGFQKIISKEEFPADQNVMSWGVADEFLFQRVFEDIMQADTPYFKTLFTLASHSPYDFPAKPWKNGNDRETQFINSVHYTDSCMGSFIHQLESQGKLENTLIIFVADHGNLFPGDLPYSSMQKFQIPMIWYGGALSKTGVVEKIASQTDIPGTLLGQMKINADKYLFSRNIFGKSYSPEAMYAFNNGFGYINDSLNFSYFQNSQKVVKVSGKVNEDTEMTAKLFYQAMYDNFLSLK
jgi:phosphoglycerol transferase MdoB-like AlkP superfamily enzyme